jgi:hypothetical protein
MQTTNLEAAPWWPDLLALRDELPLSELATRFGTTPVALVLTLKRLGISKTAKASEGATPTAKARSRGTDLARTQAWEVRFRHEERSRVLFADDFDAALGVAMRGGDVTLLTLLGPAL